MSTRAIDHAGKRFGFLGVVKRVASPPGERSAYWLCKCDCGKEKHIAAKSFVSGHVIACGCRVGGLKHGLSFTKTHRAWSSMIQRCTNPKLKSWPRYGGRGIKVCPRWRASFQAFLDDMGKAPVGMMLERKNNNGNYQPGNCKWATAKEQQNNRSSNHKVEFQGVIRNLSQWAKEAGMSHETLLDRLKRGWTMEEAISTHPTSPNRFKKVKRGSAHAFAKLDEQKVCSILIDPRSSYHIAKAYGVAPNAIRQIRDGLTWKHVSKATMTNL